MSKRNWVDINEIVAVALVVPCERQYGSQHSHIICPVADRGHGHLQFVEEDGMVAICLFCCRSQEGVAAFIDHAAVLEQDKTAPFFSEKACAVIRALPEFAKLPLAMTPEELAIVANYAVVRRFIPTVWFGE